MRWAVTGATGLLGNNLVRALVARGDEVRVLARGRTESEARDRKELAGLDVTVVPGDLDDAEALRRCFAGAEIVVHAAASVWIGWTGRDDAMRVNVDGTRAVCAAVPAAARLVHVSTVDALGLGTWAAPATEDSAPRDGEGGVPYVDSKRAADRVVRASGTDHVFVFPTYMLGPWDWKPSSGRMVLAVARGIARLAPAGGNNFVHVRDVVEGTIAAARGPSGRGWILGNENLRYVDAWRRIARVVDAPAPIGELPAWAGRAAAVALDAGAALGLREGEINGASTRMGFLPHWFDPSRARAELAMPQTSLEDAVSDAWAWFRARGYVGRA
jgi:dihydroflavonol-4-reductase